MPLRGVADRPAVWWSIPWSRCKSQRLLLHQMITRPGVFYSGSERSWHRHDTWRGVSDVSVTLLSQMTDASTDSSIRHRSIDILLLVCTATKGKSETGFTFIFIFWFFCHTKMIVELLPIPTNPSACQTTETRRSRGAAASRQIRRILEFLGTNRSTRMIDAMSLSHR